MKRALALMAILGFAGVALADPATGPTPAVLAGPEAATTFSSEVAGMTAAVKGKFDSGKTNAADFAENLDAINQLIRSHRHDPDREQLARVYLLAAHIQADGLKDSAKARTIRAHVAVNFPGTEASRGAKDSLARLDAEASAKRALELPEVHGPLPALILPVMRVQTQVYTNVIITRATTTNLDFTHSQGTSRAWVKDLDPAMRSRLTAALSRVRPPATGLEPVEIPVRALYASSFINKPAPQFIAENWITPAPDTTGKFVLIEFWATWCEPCKGAIGHLDDLQAAYRDKLVVIGISAESESVVRNYYEKNPPTVFGAHTQRWAPIRYSVAVDTEARMKAAVGVSGIPHALLIDPGGIVRFEGMPHYLYKNPAGLNRLFEKYSR